MKSILTLGIAISILTISCKKEPHLVSDDNKYVEGWTRVIGVKGTDTSTTTFMQARTQTIGLIIVEDAQLKAELISFTSLPNGKGQYKVRMTSKQSCQSILRWTWENLGITEIQPSDATANTPQSDVLNANEEKMYIILGDATLGRIKVKSEKSNSDCSNSSTLILEITNVILPIEFASSKTYRKDNTMYTTFSTETPENVDWFFVMWSPDGKKEHEVVKAYIESDHVTKNHKLSFPAIKKESL